MATKKKAAPKKRQVNIDVLKADLRVAVEEYNDVVDRLKSHPDFDSMDTSMHEDKFSYVAVFKESNDDYTVYDDGAK